MATPSSGLAPLMVSFSGAASSDSDGSIASYAWDFDDDGVDDASGETASFTFSAPGTYVVTLTVTDDDGASASATTTVTATAPAASNDAPADFEASVRFLNRATFGATEAEANSMLTGGYSAWLVDQFNQPVNEQLPRLLADGVQINANFTSPNETYITWRDFVESPDQLRQRMMFALSEILVVGDMSTGNLFGRDFALGYFRDILYRNAFGNYRDILEEVTYSPAMGVFLTYLYNQKADPATNRVPDENYAREVMQLFTIGLFELNLDGTVKTDANGDTIETYDAEDIQGLARVFTGLGLKGDGFGFSRRDDDAFYSPMRFYDEFYETGEKSFLSTVIPAGASGPDSIDMALDALFNHPNVAPFVCRQLIQRFVTGAPTPAYVERVATVFEAGAYQLPDGTLVGTGQRGDLMATLAAILLDDEALQPFDDAPQGFGKVREPVMRFVHWARAFDVNSADAENEDILFDASTTDRLAQHPSRSPSVFNYFRPGYVAPNTQSGAAGLTAPELQITNSATLTGYAATMSRYIRDERNRNRVQSPAAYVPDYTDELALADDAAALVDHLDELLTGGALQPETRDRIIEMMGLMAGSSAADREARVYIAVWMVMTAPEYLVQR